MQEPPSVVTPILEKEHPAEPRSQTLAALFLVLLCFVLQMIIGGVLSAFLSPASSTMGYYWVIGLQQGLCILLPALIFLGKRPPWVPARHKQRLSLGQIICIVLSVPFGALLISFLMANWTLLLFQFDLIAISEPFPLPQTTPEIVAGLIAIALLPGLGEELVFRRVTLTALEEKGTTYAVVVSGLLFGFMHGRLSALPGHVFLGMALGFLLIATGSLWAPMLYHMAHNGYTIFLATRIAGENTAPGEAMAFTLAGVVQAVPAACLAAALFAGLLVLATRKSFRREQAAGRIVPATGFRFPFVVRVAMGLLLAVYAMLYLIDLGNLLSRGGA